MYDWELDKFDGRLLRVQGQLCAADWSELELDAEEYLQCDPEIVVRLLLPQGGWRILGVIDDTGIVQVALQGRKLTFTTVAQWSEIEIVPDWEPGEVVT